GRRDRPARRGRAEGHGRPASGPQQQPAGL
ncbi:MAG: hypothetical protein AVDCRST_MAG55-997, partial [uncultured Rubrobacteraceae bacterium]